MSKDKSLSERLAALSPLQRALLALKETRAKLDELRNPPPMPIAVVGMACRFPGGVDSPDALWQLLREKTDAITTVPADRWDADAYYDPDPQAPGKMNTRWGGFIDGIDQFDNPFFGISRREAKAMDPQQRFLLELAWESLQDAGIVAERIRGLPVGVYIGMSTTDHGVMVYDTTNADPYNLTGNSLSIAANRLSFALDLRGPSLTVDTACSSVLTALHLACSSLRSGESQVALVGGSNMTLAPNLTVNLTKAGFSSPDGRCFAFDARANGYVRGEGSGMVVLKPLKTAIEDGNPVHAVILGSAIAQDGQSSRLTAPNRQAQQSLLGRAYAAAKVSPGDIQYVEAQGTGTLLGDTIEAVALGNVLADGRNPGSDCLLGSVKTNLGHLEAASGIASLIKTVLALKHRQVPPNMHFDVPNPKIPFDALPLQVPHTLTPWPKTEGPAMAGVSAFGFGGSLAHVVLQESPSRADSGVRHRNQPSQVTSLAQPELLVLSARNEAALHALADDCRNSLENPAVSLTDFCYTAAARRDHFESRLAVIGQSREQARRLLAAFVAGERPDGLFVGAVSPGRSPQLAFVFGDDIDLWRGIAKKIVELGPLTHAALDDWTQRIENVTGNTQKSLLQWVENQDGDNDPNITPLLLLSIQMVMVDSLLAMGITPSSVIGLGTGDLAAACTAGLLSVEDAVHVAVHRNTSVHAIPTDTQITSREARIPVVCIRGDQVLQTADLSSIHWTHPAQAVRSHGAIVEAAINTLRTAPDLILEVGLANSQDTLPSIVSLFSSNSNAHRHDILGALARLYVAGWSPDWSNVFPPNACCTPIPHYPWQHETFPIPRGSADTTQRDRQAADAVISTTKDKIIDARPTLSTTYVKPQTDLEAAIAEAWAEVLQLEQVGIHDNFMELGGDSLQATVLMNQLRERLQISLSSIALFEARNVHDLAAIIERDHPETTGQLPTAAATPANRDDILAATSEIREAREAERLLTELDELPAGAIDRLLGEMLADRDTLNE